MKTALKSGLFLLTGVVVEVVVVVEVEVLVLVEGISVDRVSLEVIEVIVEEVVVEGVATGRLAVEGLNGEDVIVERVSIQGVTVELRAEFENDSEIDSIEVEVLMDDVCFAVVVVVFSSMTEYFFLGDVSFAVIEEFVLFVIKKRKQIKKM